MPPGGNFRWGAARFERNTNAVVPLGARQWGGVVHVHSPREVAEVAVAAGLRLRRMEPCFLFSPYLYRLAPVPLQRKLRNGARVLVAENHAVPIVAIEILFGTGIGGESPGKSTRRERR